MSNDFYQRIETLFAVIEDALDESELDADFENQGSVFTVTVEGCAPLILNRHGPTEQLWLATRSGGFHLAWSDESGDWLCTRSARPFLELWHEACEAQYGQRFELDLG